jgi:hypothetical protein
MSQLLALILRGLGRSATESELIRIGFRAAPIVPGLLDGDLHLSTEQLAALSEIILDLRNGSL